MDDPRIGNALMVTALVLALAALLAAPAHAGPIDDDGNPIVRARNAGPQHGDRAAPAGVDTAAASQPILRAEPEPAPSPHTVGHGWPALRADSDNGAFDLFRNPIFALAALGLTAAATAGLRARHRRMVAMQ
jgi:hypothetical protein